MGIVEDKSLNEVNLLYAVDSTALGKEGQFQVLNRGLPFTVRTIVRDAKNTIKGMTRGGSAPLDERVAKGAGRTAHWFHRDPSKQRLRQIYKLPLVRTVTKQGVSIEVSYKRLIVKSADQRFDRVIKSDHM